MGGGRHHTLVQHCKTILHPVDVVVGCLHFAAERIQAQLHIRGRLPLQVNQAAFALAVLGEYGAAVQRCIAVWLAQVNAGGRKSCIGVTTPTGILIKLPDVFELFTLERAGLRKSLDQHAKRAVLILPRTQGRHLRVVLVGEALVGNTHAGREAQRLFEVQRAARFDIHGTRHTTLRDGCFRALVHGNTAHHVGWQ